jgi:integrase
VAKIVRRKWRGADGSERRGWQIDFTDSNGRRVRKQFQKRREADAELVRVRAQVADGTYVPDSTSATFGEACQLWLDRAAAEGLERSTCALYELQTRQLLAVIDRNAKLSRLSRAQCESARDQLLKAHNRPTARKLVAALRMILGDAKRRGLIAVNVAADTKIPASKRHKPKIKAGVDFPLPGEVRAMLKTEAPKAKAIVALAALAGLRASELRALRWSDLELGKHPTVTVSQRADAWCEIGSPKAESSRRTIPLGDTAASAMKAWKLAQPPISYMEGNEKKHHPPVLVFGTGRDKPNPLGNLQRRLLSPLQVAAGVIDPVLDANRTPVLDDEGEPVVEAKYTWHSLRHYAISSWLAAGIDLKTTQHWAGHATLAMTLDTYAHLIPRTDDHDRIATAERALLVT